MCYSKDETRNVVVELRLLPGSTSWPKHGFVSAPRAHEVDGGHPIIRFLRLTLVQPEALTLACHKCRQTSPAVKVKVDEDGGSGWHDQAESKGCLERSPITMGKCILPRTEVPTEHLPYDIYGEHT